MSTWGYSNNYVKNDALNQKIKDFLDCKMFIAATSFNLDFNPPGAIFKKSSDNRQKMLTDSGD